MHVSDPVKNERELKDSIVVDHFPNCRAIGAIFATLSS